MPFHSGRQKVQFDADLLLLWLEILHDLGAVDRGVVSHHHPVLTILSLGSRYRRKDSRSAILFTWRLGVCAGDVAARASATPGWGRS